MPTITATGTSAPYSNSGVVYGSALNSGRRITPCCIGDEIEDRHRTDQQHHTLHYIGSHQGYKTAQRCVGHNVEQSDEQPVGDAQMFSADRLRKTDREKVRGGQRIEFADKPAQARGNKSPAEPGQEVIQDREREPRLGVCAT